MVNYIFAVMTMMAMVMLMVVMVTIILTWEWCSPEVELTETHWWCCTLRTSGSWSGGRVEIFYLIFILVHDETHHISWHLVVHNKYSNIANIAILAPCSTQQRQQQQWHCPLSRSLGEARRRRLSWMICWIIIIIIMMISDCPGWFVSLLNKNSFHLRHHHLQQTLSRIPIFTSI